MIRIVLADDQALLRAGLRSVLSAEEDFTVVGEASDGAQAARMAQALDADIVLICGAGGQAAGFFIGELTRGDQGQLFQAHGFHGSRAGPDVAWMESLDKNDTDIGEHGRMELSLSEGHKSTWATGCGPCRLLTKQK